MQYKIFNLIAGQTKLRVFAIFMAMVFCAACITKPEKSTNQITITDELGRTLHVVANPQRIVSLAPSVTETLFALGVDEKVVGVTSYCDYPQAAKSKVKVGDTLRPNLERIIALKPDLVIISTSSQLEVFVKLLEEAGIPVYVNNPRTLEETINSIQRLGEISGASAQGKELAETLRARIALVHSRIQADKPPKVFIMLGAEPLITAGGKSFINDLVTQAGGISISRDESADYPQYSLETVIARQPEVIFLQAGDEKLPARLQKTPAARNGKVFHINDDLLLRPGPRIVDGLEDMAAKINSK
ncbi:MAG: cobalamin-binding protein [Acidobacteriota bacterium]